MTDEFCLKMPEFHVTFRDLSHAVNLRHGTEGFTYPPKEGELRIFSPKKIQRPANLGTKGQHATSRPPKPLNTPLIIQKFILEFIYLFIVIAGRWNDWWFWCCVECAACSLSRRAEICLDAVSQVQSLQFYSFVLPCFNTLRRHVKVIPSSVREMPELKSV